MTAIVRDVGSLAPVVAFDADGHTINGMHPEDTAGRSKAAGNGRRHFFPILSGNLPRMYAVPEITPIFCILYGM
jgi:hypothetical protein